MSIKAAVRLISLFLCLVSVHSNLATAQTVNYTSVQSLQINGTPRAKQQVQIYELGDILFLSNVGPKKVSVRLTFEIVSGRKSEKMAEKTLKLNPGRSITYSFAPSAQALNKRKVKNLISIGGIFRLRLKVPKNGAVFFEQKRPIPPNGNPPPPSSGNPPPTTTTTSSTTTTTTLPPPPATTTTSTTTTTIPPTTTTTTSSTTTTTIPPTTTTTTSSTTTTTMPPPINNATCDTGVTISSAFINTPRLHIPNFGANPTKVAVSGNWSGAIWRTPGGAVTSAPGAGDVVSIPIGVSVVYDISSTTVLNTVTISGLLAFSPDISTKMYVKNLLVLPCAQLMVGSSAVPIMPSVTAEIIFPNTAINTATDPDQYGNGLIALGRVTMHGAVKSATFQRLVGEALAGATTLTLSQAVSGWRDADRLVIPDTRQLLDGQRFDKYVKQWERPTIATNGISGNQTTITMTGALAYNHKGARNALGALEFSPHVGNLTRNVVVRSESASGVRGHVLFTHRADIDIRYTEFKGLGRSTADNPSPERYSMQFLNLYGPSAGQSNGYQFTFVGNSIHCPLDPMLPHWGAVFKNSQFGLFSQNVLFNWFGAGIAILDGSSSYNVIEKNFIVAAHGDHNPRWNDADDGSGIWATGFKNYIRDNVVANSSGAFQGIVAGSGYNLFSTAGSPANTLLPRFPGANMDLPSESVLVDMQRTPILEFARNEAYGTMATGLTLWHLGTTGYGPVNVGQSVIKDFRAWHAYEHGFFGYPINNVKFDGFVVRGSADALAHPVHEGLGWSMGDYWGENLIVQRADIQGMWAGIRGNLNTPIQLIIKDSYFCNKGKNINVETLATPGSRAIKPARRTEIRNVRFDPFPNTNLNTYPYQTISMDFVPRDGADYVQKDEVFVYDYNGQIGDNFQLYYLEQAPSFIVPATTYYGPDANNDGQPDLIDSQGIPVAMQNDLAWATYTKAIAGAVCPVTTTRPNVKGYVRPF